MTTLRLSFFFSILSLFFIACSHHSNNSDRLESALSFAGDNRGELEKTLAYYSAVPKDSLKYRAAVFLIENMPAYFSCQSAEIDSVRAIISRGVKNKLSVKQIEDSIQKINLSTAKVEKVYDSHIITSLYLIQNIEQAFAAKEQHPWGKDISFSDFCEYVLPYRIGFEPLSDWRETFARTYQSLLDSCMTTTDIIEACKIINKYNREREWKFALGEGLGTVQFSPLFLMENYIGSCVEMSHFTIAAMRSVGIPVGSDYIKVRPESHNSHYWNFVIDTTGISCDFSNFEADPKRHTFVTFLDKKGKVYRKTFSYQNNELLQYKSVNEIPVSLRSNFEKDVSKLYFPVNQIDLELKNVPKGENIVYLCTFNDREWMPVAWAVINHNKAAFKYTDCRHIAYLPAYFRGDSIVPAAAPFITKDGHFLYTAPADTAHKQTVRVYRKFHERDRFFHEIMIGGKFQVSNDRNFNAAKDVFQITEFPYGFFSFRLPDNLPLYRYVRYYSRDGIRGDIAEMEVYGTDTTLCLKGKPIGIPGHNYDPNIAPEKAFDGDPLTNYISQYEKGAWVGLDLEKPTKITKIRFIPRGDDNSIRLNDEYELLWFSPTGWLSLGKQTAKHFFLEFKNAPKDALFWLRDHTRGKEERIFTYEEEKQIFW